MNWRTKKKVKEYLVFLTISFIVYLSACGILFIIFGPTELDRILVMLFTWAWAIWQGFIALSIINDTDKEEMAWS